MRPLKFAPLALALLLTGCSFTTAPTSQTPNIGSAIRGNVHGGSQPVVGAHVYLFAASSSNYGGNGILASALNASAPLLNASSTGHSDSLGAYVVTDASGAFNISADYNCTPGTQVYFYVEGGNPGAGLNSAATFLAILGNCPATTTFAGAIPFVTINEVSTVAAAYAMAGFASDSTHVSSSSSSQSQQGLANAFANAANIANIASGAALAVTPGNTSSEAPQTLVNTIANILASCVNTSSSSSSPCTTLLTNTLDQFGNRPTNTADATINLAHSPAAAVGALWNLQPAAAPFQPDLTLEPADYTLLLKFWGGGLSGGGDIAFDANGDLYVTDGNAISEFSSTGVPLSYFTGGGLSGAGVIAIDPFGNIWALNGNSISKFSSSGTAYSGTSGFYGGGLDFPVSMAVDGLGNVWTTSFGSSINKFSNLGIAQSPSIGWCSGGSYNPRYLAIDANETVWIVDYSHYVIAVSNQGTCLNPTSGFTGGGLSESDGIAIDADGSIWTVNYSGSTGNSVTKLASDGAAVSPSTGFLGGGLFGPGKIAVDGANTIWVNNTAGYGSLSSFSSAGVALSPSGGYANSGDDMHDLRNITIDPSGNAWVNADIHPTSIDALVELVGIAAPVVTPTASAIAANALGTRP